jgi:hypothetical protein
MIAKRLNAEGIQTFEDYIQKRREGRDVELPEDILAGEQYTEVPDTEVEVEEVDFENRMEMARYLSDVFPDADPAIEKDQGLWTWLALYYFDQLCPPDKTPNRTYQYVLRGDDNYKHYYRHLVNGPYRLYRIHGSSARTMLAGPVHQHPDMAEQIASRQEVVTNEAMVQVADYMYWDSERDDYKRGATNKEDPGTVRRLIKVHDQLKRTYDVVGMNAEQVLGLLPSEFEGWMPEG